MAGSGEVAGMIRMGTGRSGGQCPPVVVMQGPLCQLPLIDENADDFRCGNHRVASGDTDRNGEGKRRGADPGDPHGKFEDLVVACPGLPFDEHPDHLSAQLTPVQFVVKPDGSKIFGCGKAGIVGITGIEYHLLRIALRIAHPQVITEILRFHELTSALRAEGAFPYSM